MQVWRLTLAMPPGRQWGLHTYWRDSENLVFHVPESKPSPRGG
jgi:hypothetical protein